MCFLCKSKGYLWENQILLRLPRSKSGATSHSHCSRRVTTWNPSTFHVSPATPLSLGLRIRHMGMSLPMRVLGRVTVLMLSRLGMSSLL